MFLDFIKVQRDLKFCNQLFIVFLCCYFQVQKQTGEATKYSGGNKNIFPIQDIFEGLLQNLHMHISNNSDGCRMGTSHYYNNVFCEF